jgi:hypothetical protein
MRQGIEWRITALAAAIAGVLVQAPALAGQPATQPAYRTTITPITPDRWTKPLPPLPERQNVTREDYLKYIKERWLPLREASLKQLDRIDGAQHWNVALREAFFCKITGDEQYVRTALAAIRADVRFRTEGPGKDFAKFHAACPAMLPSMTAYHWIRDSKMLTPADHALVKTWVLMLVNNYAYYECGAMNRGIGASGCVMVANHWYPDTADQPLTSNKVLPWVKDKDFTRRQYVDFTWNHWWRFRDFYEDSAGYESHSLEMILETWAMTGQLDLLKDPAIVKLADRFLAQVAPNGAMPGYGDGTNYNTGPGRWVWFFEAMTAATKDGRYKWVAHRFFEFLRRHEKDFEQWGNPIYWELDNLMQAYVLADESIQPVEPTIGCVVTHRKDLKWLDARTTGRWADLVDRDMPSKLCLRTGWRPGDTSVLVELCKPMSHGHANTGSIESLISRGSVLLSAPAYQARTENYHNSFIAWPDRRPAGFVWNRDILHGGKTAVTVPTFHAGDGVAYARIHVTDYLESPATLDRRVFFLGDDGLWVRDTIQAPKSFQGTIGPAYQFTGVYPKKGEHWANACQTSVPVAFIFKPEYMMQFTNRPIDLLVWYAPKPDATLAIDDVTLDTTHLNTPDELATNFKQRVWYQMKLDGSRDRQETFDSVLRPHTPREDAEPLAKGIRVLLDEGTDRAVVGIEAAPGHIRYAGINADGKPLTAGPIQTDAKAFSVTVGPAGAVAHWLVEATTLNVDSKTVFHAKNRKTEHNLAP